MVAATSMGKYGRTWKYPALKEEDKFTSDETAGPSDQLMPVDNFAATWGVALYGWSAMLWFGSIFWILVIVPILLPDEDFKSTPEIKLMFTIMLPPFLYWGYMRECTNAKTLDYLSNEITFDRLTPKIDAMRKARPTFQINVRCSHQTTSGSGNNQSTHTVVTFDESYDFPYEHHEDISRFNLTGMTVADLIPPSGGIEVVTVDMPQFLCMNTVMLENYDLRMGEYYEENKYRDSSCVVSFLQTWPEHMEECILILKQDFLISKTAYWIFSILGLSLPYRMFFQHKTGSMVLPIRKKVGQGNWSKEPSNPVSGVGVAPSATTPDAIPDASQRLEKLEALRAKGLIQDSEYEEKRAEIMKSV